MKRMYSRLMVTSLLVAAGVVPSLARGANEDLDRARQIYQAKQDGVLWIEASVKLLVSAEGFPTQTREDKVRAIGTVIDESGLMVASLSDLDPAVQLDGRKQRNPQTGQTMTISATTEFQEVKVRLADKTEVPARIVMKDVDWDLVFVQIDTSSDEFADQQLQPVNLAPDAEARELEELVIVSRMNKNMKYIPAVSMGRIAAVAKRPRTLYISQGGQLGAAAFKLNGQALGIFVVWRNKAEGSQSRVILPSRDVLDIAKQASAAAEKLKNEAAEGTAEDE